MALIKCPKCGHENISSTATQCPYCKVYVQDELKKQAEKKMAPKYETCPECKNTKVPGNSITCPMCGFNIMQYQNKIRYEMWKIQYKAEQEARAKAVIIGLYIYLFFLLIGYVFLKMDSILGLIILIATILFIVNYRSGDPKYADQWTLYGVVCCLITVANGAIVGWIMLSVIASILRYKASQKD